MREVNSWNTTYFLPLKFNEFFQLLFRMFHFKF